MSFTILKFTRYSFVMLPISLMLGCVSSNQATSEISSSDHIETRSIEEHVELEFIKNEDTRGEGVTAFKIKVKDIKSIKRKAKELKLLVDGEIVIGGVKFLLS